MTILPARSSLAALAMSLVLSTPLWAGAVQAETPESFVRRVYARYRADGPGVPMSRPGGAPFYAPELLDAFAKDQADSQTEGVTIDWDPICSCQDYNLRLQTVTVTKAEADTVKARADFTNLRSRHSVVLTLSQTPAGWRIADVADGKVKSVVALLREAATHPAQPNGSGSTPPKN